MKTTAGGLFLLLLAAAAAHMLHYYPLLPDVVASHYGGSGQPDGWSSKESFLAINAAVIAILAIAIIGPVVLMPRMPTSMINLPNKDYWLAPERRQETFAAISSNLLRLGSAFVVFLIATMHLVFEVNLGQRPTLGNAFWGLLIGLLLVVGLEVAWLVNRFRVRGAG